MQNFSRWLILAIITLTFSSCASALREKVSLEGLHNVKLMGLSGVRADLVLRNESWHNVRVKDVEIAVKKGEKQVTKVILKDDIVIPRKSTAEVIPTIWKFSEADPIAIISASGKILSGETEDFNVDIDAVGKVSVIKKKFEYRNISIPSLINRIK